MPDKPIEIVLREQASRLMTLPGVVGVGQGETEGEPSIIVMVVRKSSSLDEQIPATLDGYAVVVEETGEIEAD